MMKNRKRNRKRGFDYSSEAIYFVTICTQNHHLWFGNVEDKQMILNDAGSIGWEQVEWLENQYPYFQLHNGVVMPNHIHLLFEIDTRHNTAEQKVKIGVGVGGRLQNHRFETDSQHGLAGILLATFVSRYNRSHTRML